MGDPHAILAGKAMQLGPGENLHSLLSEAVLHRASQIFVAVGENVVTALDQRYLRANPTEELGELQGDGATAEDDHGFGPLAKIQDLVAGEVADFVEAAAGTDCQVLGCFEALRPVVDTQVLRAMAARYWEAGADGLYFFNYYSMPAEWKTDVLGELADPRKLSRLSKQYQIDHTRPSTIDSQIGHAFRHCVPLAQLPARLEETRTGEGVKLHFDLAEDLDKATREGHFEGCVLGLGFENLLDGDELAVTLNDQDLAWGEGEIPSQGWTEEVYDGAWNKYPSRTVRVPLDLHAVEFRVDSQLRRGANTMQIQLVRRAGGAPALVLQSVRIIVNYKA